MSWQPVFPEPEEEVIVETPLMRAVASRTMAVHKGGAVVIWTGPPRNGKTETAKWMVRRINEAYDKNPHAFRALHYEVGEIEKFSGNEMKRGLRSLYHATIGPLAESVYRRQPIEALAAQLVTGLRAKNLQLVHVDEAGLLSLDAIRGMILVRNTAQNMRWTLTLVFIGMDDLPTKVRELVHVRHRIHEWCYFKPYSLSETHGLLAALHPHFATLRLNRVSDRAQVAFIHEQFHGLPGLIVAFLKKLRYREQELGLSVDLDMLRAVHLMTVRDEESAVADATNGYESPEHSTEEIVGYGVDPDAEETQEYEEEAFADDAEDTDETDGALEEDGDGGADDVLDVNDEPRPRGRRRADDTNSTEEAA